VRDRLLQTFQLGKIEPVNQGSMHFRLQILHRVRLGSRGSRRSTVNLILQSAVVN
jgi:hypothetical protein